MIDFIEKAIPKIKSASVNAANRVKIFSEFDHVATQETLTNLVTKKLKGRSLILASNREPYAHIRGKEGITWFRSAGGLTIALDSMAAACNAVWVCHGEANADFKVTDDQGRVKVPPDHPKYTLKRIRLTREEEHQYYDVFANETLWPLCHVCYVRPKFHSAAWEMYQKVNRKFADAISQEAPTGSIVFLQDYHFCLVGQYLKQQRPDLTSVLFWHIPWPNPEIFRILPWKKELLEGLLANDIVGFHLKYHADNFMSTLGVELEGRLDWERMLVERNQSRTRVRYYPISIDFSAVYQQAERLATAEVCHQLREKHNLTGVKIGLGVDRIDYTKGIPERMVALDLLFARHPEFREQFTFIQIGVPSRTRLEDYQQVVAHIERQVRDLNAKYRTARWQPVLFLKGHHDYNTLIPFYKLADVCVVSSLHDGMNLVAKEFVAASSNDRGVLLLSHFTGAARELEQALLFNPYDAENFSDHLFRALTMSLEEQKNRLERMRVTVAENNIFTWAQAIFNDIVKLAEDSQAVATGD